MTTQSKIIKKKSPDKVRLNQEESINPVEAAEYVAQNFTEYCFFYPSLNSPLKNQSILCFDKEKELIGNNIEELRGKVSNDDFLSGYFAYSLEGCISSENDKLTSKLNGDLLHSGFHLIGFSKIVIFEHIFNKNSIYGDDKEQTKYKIKYIGISKNEFIEMIKNHKIAKPIITNKPKIHELKTNIEKEQYLEKIAKIKEYIKQGRIYQVNLTKKYFGKLTNKPNIFSIFKRLNNASPSRYSSVMQIGNIGVISSSPELFIKLSKNGEIISEPIKGSAPRSKDKKQDELAKQQLISSEKERAENLMITDMTRNDLSHICKIGTIKVEQLFKLMQHKTIYHLSSLVSGKLKKDKDITDVIKNIFPPASMTGTPKIEAMKVISELERRQRGIYSGAIGWILGNRQSELSVAIRSIFIQDDYFEFQVGGGIVYDSDPESEYQELITKAIGICEALDIDINTL